MPDHHNSEKTKASKVERNEKDAKRGGAILPEEFNGVLSNVPLAAPSLFPPPFSLPPSASIPAVLPFRARVKPCPRPCPFGADR